MTNSERNAELIAAAIAGESTAAEQEELARACELDPTLLDELNELQGVVQRLDRAQVAWSDHSPPDDLGRRIADAVEARRTPPIRSFIRRVGYVAAAAGFIAIGAVGTILIQQTLEAPPTGPPGTLGAVEEITFVDVPDNAAIDAALIAHTWGTETLLEISGLDLGETFSVVLVSHDGRRFDSGTFFATEETVVCRMNAAILREDVSQVRITALDGSVRAVADLPPAEA